MIITKVQANELCESVVKSIANWPAVSAALQSGGLEEKARGRFASAIEDWLQESKEKLLVLPEYRKIDFALIHDVEIQQGQLSVDTVIEVKFNYATQAPNEMVRRVPKGIRQAIDYRDKVAARNAYVLYLVAAPSIAERPETPHDTGWRYWGQANLEIAKSAIQDSILNSNATLIGQFEKTQTHLFYCCLISTEKPVADGSSAN